MNKTSILQAIITQLSHDLEILFSAAKTAHEASRHAENVPDNKYDTMALEASYVAQGQANRANQIRTSLEIYKQLESRKVADDTIRLVSLVTLEDAEGVTRKVFIGPAEGGLKIEHEGEEIVVITPVSPVGRELLGKSAGDSVAIEAGTKSMEYDIVAVC